MAESENYAIFDCLLVGECESIDGTNVQGTSGVDFDACGTQASPCKTLMYAVDKTPAQDWVNVLYDTSSYYVSNITFPGRTVLVRGISSSGDTPQKPTFQSNFSSSSLYMIRFYDSNSFTTLDNLIFLYSNVSYRRPILYVYADSGQLNFWFVYY
jgi:hypothetical protein